MMARITLADIARMEDDFIPGTMAAEALGIQRGRLSQYARERPELIHFPYQLSGSRMRVARVPFLRYWGFSEEEITKKELRRVDETRQSPERGACV